MVRDGRVYGPERDATLEAHDELLFIAPPEAEAELEQVLAPLEHDENSTGRPTGH